MITFTTTKPGPLMSLNDRQHHMAKARLTRTWREAAFWWAKQHKVRCHTDQIVTVLVEFGTDRPNQRRDNSNVFPCVKAICDGFTDAAVWPDDDSKHVATLEPRFVTDIAANELRITLTWPDPKETS